MNDFEGNRTRTAGVLLENDEFITLFFFMLNALIKLSTKRDKSRSKHKTGDVKITQVSLTGK